MKKLNLVVALLAMCAAGGAWADDAAPMAPDAPAASGVYVGAAAIRANYSGTTTAANGITRVTPDHKTAGKGYVGYQFTPYVGAELGYADLGQSNGIKGEGGYLDVVGTAPLGGGVDLIGKVGVADMKTTGALDTSYKTGGDVGIGLAYHLNQTVALRGEVERFDKVGKDLKANVGSVGLQFGF